MAPTASGGPKPTLPLAVWRRTGHPGHTRPAPGIAEHTRHGPPGHWFVPRGRQVCCLFRV